MQRRRFITLSTITAFAVGAPFLNCSEPDLALDKLLAMPQTLSSLQDENTLVAIGRAYGASHPDEYSLRKLERKLAENNLSSDTPPNKIFATLDKAIQADFDSGNIMILQGWVLSITEARQCALFSLMVAKK